MANFMVFYHAPAGAWEQMANMTPEQQAEGMKHWMTWAEKSGSGLLDLGAPLGNGQKVAKSGSAPSTSDIAGYSILQAENMDAAKKLIEGHPHLEWNAACEIEWTTWRPGSSPQLDREASATSASPPWVEVQPRLIDEPNRRQS